MNATINIIKILREIITKYGLPTESNLTIYRGLMYDLLVDHIRELNLLKITLEQGLVFRLVKENSSIPYEVLAKQMVNHLHSTFGMDMTAAKWAIDTWSEALGIHFLYTCIADFSLNPARGPAPHLVQFTNTSKGEVSQYEWEFGDEEYSTEKNPTHIFQNPGVYSITLHAHHDSFVSEKNLFDAVIVEYPELKAEISSDIREGEVPLRIQFSKNCQGLVRSYEWDFGDGEHSFEPDPSHEYKRVGEYLVSLTVTDGNSSTKTILTKSIVINPQKIRSDFSALPIRKENPLIIQFTNNSRGDEVKYQWDFGDGLLSEEQHVLHEYSYPGKYQVTLTVTNEITGETDTIQKEIPTILPPLEAGFSHTKSEDVPPLSIQFTSISKGFIQKYEWNFGDGEHSTEKDPVHIYKKPGRYSVELVISDGEEYSKCLKKLAIIVKPPNFNADFTCDEKSGFFPLKIKFTAKFSNPDATYQWKFGDGRESSEQNPLHVYNYAGKFSVSLRVNHSGFTEEEIQKNVIEVKPVFTSSAIDVVKNHSKENIATKNETKKIKKPFSDNEKIQSSNSQIINSSQSSASISNNKIEITIISGIVCIGLILLIMYGINTLPTTKNSPYIVQETLSPVSKVNLITSENTDNSHSKEDGFIEEIVTKVNKIEVQKKLVYNAYHNHINPEDVGNTMDHLINNNAMLMKTPTTLKDIDYEYKQYIYYSQKGSDNLISASRKVYFNKENGDSIANFGIKMNSESLIHLKNIKERIYNVYGKSIPIVTTSMDEI